ncbi:MAG: hypothetical protein M3O31_09275 [Acidobacteriota bacterium]|nr:hypothetical protein [Acidobacteriota bacterium]
MIAIAHKVYDGPVSLSDLDVFLSQARQLGSAQTTAKKNRNHRDVSNAA